MPSQLREARTWITSPAVTARCPTPVLTRSRPPSSMPPPVRRTPRRKDDQHLLTQGGAAGLGPRRPAGAGLPPGRAGADGRPGAPARARAGPCDPARKGDRSDRPGRCLRLRGAGPGDIEPDAGHDGRRARWRNRPRPAGRPSLAVPTIRSLGHFSCGLDPGHLGTGVQGGEAQGTCAEVQVFGVAVGAQEHRGQQVRARWRLPAPIKAPSPGRLVVGHRDQPFGFSLASELEQVRVGGVDLLEPTNLPFPCPHGTDHTARDAMKERGLRFT